jgi:hypothetical protein
MRPQAFGLAEIEIVHISKESPMWLDFVLKLPKELVIGVIEGFQLVFSRLYFPEMERRKKAIAVERDMELLRQERLRTFAAAIDLENKISDPQLRELFLSGLRSSLAPFESEHPEIEGISFSTDEE